MAQLHSAGADRIVDDDLTSRFRSLSVAPLPCAVDSLDVSSYNVVIPRPRGALRHGDGFVDIDAAQDEDDALKMYPTGSGEPYKLQGWIFKMLYPHQREGLRWLWLLHCRGTGGVLGDDMRLGKTMQISAFLSGLLHSRLIKRVLVVAPKTRLTHWMEDLSVVGLKEMMRDYSSSSINVRNSELHYAFKEGGILLTTYDIVRKNYKLIRGDFYDAADDEEEVKLWNYVILDDGHTIKNPKTQKAQSILKIPCVHRIVVSGTPFQNNLKDVWDLLYFCCPDVLGDKDEFRIRYEKPLLYAHYKNATDQENQMGSQAAKELRERIKPYFLRRLKSEVFDDSVGDEDKYLPQKNQLIIWLKLTSCQRQLYVAFLNSQLDHSRTEPPKGFLDASMILKKICDHPWLLTKRAAEDVVEETGSILNNQYMCMVEQILKDKVHDDNMLHVAQDVSCKIAFILPLLKNLVEESHNVLILSQTCKMLNLIQEALLLEGHRFLRIDGSIKLFEREKIVKDFQEGSGASILLLTSKVRELSKTVTKADRVIVVDPSWNPSLDNQSADCAHQVGQTKDVIVYRLLTCGTIEEKIYQKEVFNRGLFRTVMEHKEQPKYFNKEDIHNYVSLPPEGFDVSLTQHQLQEEHGQELNMDESLRKHVQFLEQQGIAGVSHHSLLFHEPSIMASLEDSAALDRAAPASIQKDEFLVGPAIEHTYTDAGSLMRTAQVEKMMDHLEVIRRQITDLEQEYVSQVVKMLERTKWDTLHLQRTREQIDNLHQEYAAGFDEMVERIRRQVELRIRTMEAHVVELDLAELDKTVERVMMHIDPSSFTLISRIELFCAS